MADIKESALEERIHRSLSNVDEDDKDIFANFEDLKENNNDTTSQPLTSTSSRNSMKFQDNDTEDWDEGVGAKEDAIFDAEEDKDNKDNNNSNNNSSNNYVKSKIQELTTVKEQIESTKDNPNILNALCSVLDSLKKQIESAYDNSKIDAEDHQTLLDRLHSVRELIASK